MPNPGDVRVFQRDLPGDGFYRTSPGSSYFTEVTGVSYDAGSNELLATVDGFSEFVFTSASNPLPVELAGLTATPTGSDVTIQWQTTSETGNRQFTIERSVAGEAVRSSSEANEWTAIGSVEGAGTTAQAQSYRFMDTGVPYAANRVEYRLRQIDVDGSETVSAPVTVRRTTRAELQGPFPNPTRGPATLRYAVPTGESMQLVLYDVLGRRVRTVATGEGRGRTEAQLDTDRLASGTYFLRLTTESQVLTERLTVTR